jgi:hypothetical protein
MVGVRMVARWTDVNADRRHGHDTRYGGGGGRADVGTLSRLPPIIPCPPQSLLAHAERFAGTGPARHAACARDPLALSQRAVRGRIFADRPHHLTPARATHQSPAVRGASGRPCGRRPRWRAAVITVGHGYQRRHDSATTETASPCAPARETLRVVGIDDWAWRKGQQHFGTIFVDWSGAASWTCSRCVRPMLSRPGSPRTLASRPSAATPLRAVRRRRSSRRTAGDAGRRSVSSGVQSARRRRAGIASAA